MPAKIRTDHLPPILKRAFDHLVRSGDYPKTPDWSRSIRIGMDYPLQVTLPRPIESDEVADAVARLCCQLGNLQEAAFLPAASRKVGGAFVQIAFGHQVGSGQ